MSTNHPPGFKVPTRPAPAPPPGAGKPVSQTSHRSNLMDSWDFSFDDAFPTSNGPSPLTEWPDKQPNKKIPPPRPPPPKITSVPHKNGAKPTSKLPNGRKQPSRPKELVSNFFSRRGQKSESPVQAGLAGTLTKSTVPTLPPVPTAIATASLIDLSSPPSSPTPTTRSSSDGLSVDSFGSDGTTSLSHHHSQVESGFEDDSELFGGFTATPSPIQRDPWATATATSTPNDVFTPVGSSAWGSPGISAKSSWSSTPQDPFSPPRRNNPTPSPTPTPISQPVPVSAPTPGVVAFKPTIIRPKPKPNSSPAISRAKPPVLSSPVQFDAEEDGDRSDSPPMPTVPPPAPPPELLSDLGDVTGKVTCSSSINGPHCVALFDFQGSHADDLSFKEGELIEVVQELNGDWLRGRLHGKEGMFPSNFVKVVVPLTDTGGIDAGSVVATALYTFAAETWEDLDLQEGDQVRLISRINADWLYGEHNGKCGQFPASFIENVPADLPTHST